MLHCILSLCAFPDTPREAKAPGEGRVASFVVLTAQDARKKQGADMRANLLTRMRALEKRTALTYQVSARPIIAFHVSRILVPPPFPTFAVCATLIPDRSLHP
jgi:hypothetical protein